MLLHLPAFRLNSNPQLPNNWQGLAPHIRLSCTFLTVFAISLTPNGNWWTWFIYGLGILSIIRMSRVSLKTLLPRVAIEFSFVGVVLLGTLFHRGGKVIWAWGWLQVTTAGLTILGSVTLKVLLSLLILNVLILTTSIPALLQAFILLRMPPLLVAIMAAMYRYLNVLTREFTTMRRAAMSRNLMQNPQAIRLVIGNMMGSLFIRTYERGERIHLAMLSRGYQGLPVRQKMPPLSKQDILALSLTVIWLLLGQVI